VSNGLDFTGRPGVPALHGYGATFTCRYLCYPFASGQPNPKVITKPERDSYLAAGISVVYNFEWYETRMHEGRPAGLADAGQAQRLLDAIGDPGAAVIYSDDTDSAPRDQPAIDAYLDAAAYVHQSVKRVGFYGGFWPLSRVRADGKATWLWGAGPAWSMDPSRFGHTMWETVDWKPHIMQFLNPFTWQISRQVYVGGVQCDPDWATAADFGQVRPPAPPPPPDWQVIMLNRLPTLQQGATGEHVRRVQGECAAHGVVPMNLTLAQWMDGVFGQNTKNAVMQVQRQHGLTPDGIVGPKTWTVLVTGAP
jgi:hypothetical protein